MEKQARYIALAAAAKAREDEFEGRKYLVIPVVALVEGVVTASNAAGPELVLAEEFSKFPIGWNGRPIFLDHPMRNGVPVSGNSPDLLEDKKIGIIFNSSVKKGKLTMEAWIDVEKAEQVAPEILERVAAGDPIEISVGVFAEADDTSGEYAGKKYKGAWRNLVPDHLALLSKGTNGACNNEMGCGVRAAELKASIIKHEGDKWVLYSHDGKKLGTHDTKAEAEAQERAIKSRKNAEANVTKEKIERWLATNPIVPITWVEKACPECADKMRSLNITHLKVAQLPEGTLEGLCKKFGAEDGFRTRCMDSSLAGEVDDAAAFCNWLKGQCHGTTRAASKKTMFTRMLDFFRVAQSPDEMSNSDLLKKLYDALRKVEPNLNYVQDYYPVVNPDRVVFSVYEPAASNVQYASTGYTYCLYERPFELSDSGVVTVGDTRVRVEPVITYEPVQENGEPVIAESTEKKAANGTTGESCSCGRNQPKANSQGETDMTKEAIVKALENASAEQIKALSEALEGTNPAVKTAQDAQAKAEAELKAAKEQSEKDVKAAQDKAAADVKAANENPAYVAFKAAQETAKAETIKALKATGRCDMSDEVLAAKTQAELDQLVKLAGAPKTAVDFSGQAAREGATQAKEAPAAPSLVDAVKAAQATK